MPRFDGTSLFDPPFFLASSERNFPNSRRSEFLAQWGLKIEDLVLVCQVHGAEVVVVEDRPQVSTPLAADALLTSRPGPVLGILTADCIPVFLWDKSKRVAGIVHAGWRGLKAGILVRVLEKFRNRFHSDPASLRIFLGPAIRECCYEVGEEFQSFFPSHYRVPVGSGKAQVLTERKPKGHVDLIGIALEQLMNEGISGQNILDSGICTSCRNERFFSARREDTSERTLSLIQIRPE